MELSSFGGNLFNRRSYIKGQFFLKGGCSFLFFFGFFLVFIGYFFGYWLFLYKQKKNII